MKTALIIIGMFTLAAFIGGEISKFLGTGFGILASLAVLYFLVKLLEKRA